MSSLGRELVFTHIFDFHIGLVPAGEQLNGYICEIDKGYAPVGLVPAEQ